MTSQDAGDASQVEALLGQIDDPTGQFTADGACDGNPTYDAVKSIARVLRWLFGPAPRRRNGQTSISPVNETVISRSTPRGELDGRLLPAQVNRSCSTRAIKCFRPKLVDSKNAIP